MEANFLGFIDGKAFFRGTKVRLYPPIEGISTATVDGIDDQAATAANTLILRNLKANNGKHIAAKYKRAKFIYVAANAVDIISHPKTAYIDKFKIWF